MEEHGLQLSPETIDCSHEADDAEMKTGDTEMKAAEADTGGGEDKEEEDEEFYERIEAPKFVDFTKPHPFRPDDRYWFCSRVGCDQKHEEEIDPDEISKNFVLRVLAARSPNIKLRKAMNQKHSSMKCPLSAPAKPSKSRIPRLASMVSSISHKTVDPESKIKPPSKVTSTPMARSRQVAAKYMTTPRNKRCLPNPESFRSVQNPKPSTVNEPKNRTVAKALVFNSPKKAINLKKSVEWHSPLTKVCEGMKRLAMRSQKKTSKDVKSNLKKPTTKDSTFGKKGKGKEPTSTSKSIRAPCKVLTDKSQTLCEQAVNKTDVDVQSTNGPASETSVIEGGNDQDKSQTLRERAVQKTDVDVQSTNGSASETSAIKGGNKAAAAVSMADLEDKENMGSAEDHQPSEIHDNEEKGMDDKENAFDSEDCNRVFSKNRVSKKNPANDILRKNKLVHALNKNSKGSVAATAAGPALVKYKKPKPTNVKPFRLRTDERGVLKEANLEKKLHVPAAAKDRDVIITSTNVQKQTSTEDPKVSRARARSKLTTKTTQKRPESTQQSLKSLTSRALSKRENALRTNSPPPRRPGVASPGPQLGAIKEKSCKVTGDATVAEGKTKADSGLRSTSRGKRPVTLAKEPNFRNSHLPRSCTKNAARQ